MCGMGVPEKANSLGDSATSKKEVQESVWIVLAPFIALAYAMKHITSWR